MFCSTLPCLLRMPFWRLSYNHPLLAALKCWALPLWSCTTVIGYRSCPLRSTGYCGRTQPGATSPASAYRWRSRWPSPCNPLSTRPYAASPFAAPLRASSWACRRLWCGSLCAGSPCLVKDWSRTCCCFRRWPGAERMSQGAAMCWKNFKNCWILMRRSAVCGACEYIHLYSLSKLVEAQETHKLASSYLFFTREFWDFCIFIHFVNLFFLDFKINFLNLIRKLSFIITSM